MMDLDELQSVQSRERQTDSLQQLRESFYRDAGEFIDQLRRERDRAAEQADDPWNAPDVSRLTDDIDTAEGTVEAIYERRVGKIVKMASLAAADMPTEDEGLTAEERDLFDTLVDAIEHNRLQVEAILDGDDPASVATGEAATGDPSPGPGASDAAPSATDEASTPADPGERPASDPEDGGRVDAADLMGGDGPESDPGPPPERDDAPVPPSEGDIDRSAGAGPDTSPSPDSSAGHDQSADSNPPADANAPVEQSSEPPTEQPPESPVDDPEPGRETGPDAAAEEVQTIGGQPETQQIERETVRITDDVGEIFGVDERRYDLTADDVVTLPADNAKPLVERDAAERLD